MIVKMKNKKGQRGITLIALSITILVLIIISSITITTGIQKLELKSINNLESDIDSLYAKVLEYYLKNESLPILVNQYMDSKEHFEALLLQNVNAFSGEGPEDLVNPNDSGAYYVIDLSKLEGLIINYGSNYKNWNMSSSSQDIQNIYVINETTLQIYYPQGIRYEDEIYFTKTMPEQEITPIQTEGTNSWNLQTSTTKNTVSQEDYLITNITLTTTGTQAEKFQYAFGDSSDYQNLDFIPFELDNSDNANLQSRIFDAETSEYWLFIKVIYESGHEEIISQQLTVN